MTSPISSLFSEVSCGVLFHVAPLKKFAFRGGRYVTFDAARGMASGFDTRVSSNSSPTGISKGAGALGRGVTFTVTYAGC